MDRNDYDDWIFFMKHSIAAAVIAEMAVRHVRDGHGGALPEDMERFADEGYGVAALWVEMMKAEKSE